MATVALEGHRRTRWGVGGSHVVQCFTAAIPRQSDTNVVHPADRCPATTGRALPDFGPRIVGLCRYRFLRRHGSQWRTGPRGYVAGSPTSRDTSRMMSR